jgi:hypothetical protein
MAVMATLVTTAGWGLASGTAKADVARPDYRCDYCFHGRDHRFDRDRDFRGVYDRGFHDHGFFNPFFGFRPRY